MLSVNRPIEVVVLNCCVTETKVTPFRSNTSTSFAKSVSERREPVDLVDDDGVDPAGLDVGQQALQRRAAPASPPLIPAIIVAVGSSSQPSALWLAT